MSSLSLVGLSGNISSPSKIRTLVQTTLDLAADRVDAQTRLLEVPDFCEDLGWARRITDRASKAQAKVAELLSADTLIVASLN